MRPHRIATGGCRENRPGPAHTLERRGGILCSSIDVHARAQFSCKLFLIPPAPDCDRAQPHAPSNWDPEMPQAAHALHRDQTSTAQARVATIGVGPSGVAEE